jgi:hypothetical protein
MVHLHDRNFTAERRSSSKQPPTSRRIEDIADERLLSRRRDFAGDHGNHRVEAV